MPELINFYTQTLSKIPVLVLIILAALSVTLGDYSAKAWSINHKGAFLFFAFAGYFFSGFFYIPTLLKQGLIITSVLWGVLSTIGFLIIGFLIFKEQLTPVQVIAATLGIISILLFNFFE
jgi:multidrug transporter EmrE-like cation transporter